MRFFRGGTQEEARRRMVEQQIRRRGVADESVLEAMRRVPRHEFVPSLHAGAAYSDCALPIGHGATISQPYIVARMTEALELRPGMRVLEVGTGSGYQAAVLAACGCRVFSVERVRALHEKAASRLESLGVPDVALRLGDGSRGWPEEAPFERIVVTAAAAAVPTPLWDQLAEGGLLVAPVGDEFVQTIRRYRKREGDVAIEDIEGARFVPLIEDPEPPAETS